MYVESIDLPSLMCQMESQIPQGRRMDRVGDTAASHVHSVSFAAC